jgi:hypothetical protein
MGSSGEMKTALDKLVAKIDEMKVSLDRLAPLAPVAADLAKIPSKVVTLQSSAYETAEQVQALNLVLYRVENSQREGKVVLIDDDDSTAHFPGEKPKQGVKPSQKQSFQPPPKDRTAGPPPHRGRGSYDEDEDAHDSRFHPRVRLEFPTFDDKEDPLTWLNRCETFFRGQGTPERRRFWYAAMHLTGAAQLWYARLELTSGTPSWCHFAHVNTKIW